MWPWCLGTDHHDLAGRLTASWTFWDVVMGEPTAKDKIEEVCRVAVDYDPAIDHLPFPGYIDTLGLRLLCKLWSSLWTPDTNDFEWHKTLVDRMIYNSGNQCKLMLTKEFWTDWLKKVLSSPQLGAYYLHHLCEKKSGCLLLLCLERSYFNMYCPNNHAG